MGLTFSGPRGGDSGGEVEEEFLKRVMGESYFLRLTSIEERKHEDCTGIF